MKILAIETSCDETAVSVLEMEGSFGIDFSYKILGNALRSQAALHAQYGGVFPNLAKNEHSEHIVPLLTQALNQADQHYTTSPKMRATLSNFDTLLAHEPALLEQLPVFLNTHARPDIDCIAVTAGPGLEPALWVGVNTARALSLAWDMPLVAVNHMEGHVLASLLDGNGALHPAPLPVISLLVSGGHTELILMKDIGQYEYLGRTRDDAAGEAFDKIARMMGLPYPGGPEISKLATQARTGGKRALPAGNIAQQTTSVYTLGSSPNNYHGKNSAFPAGSARLPRPMINTPDYDFSFAGLKTAAKKLIDAHSPLTDNMRAEIARETEDAIVDVLVSKTMCAVEEYGVRTILVGGGVAANKHLREQFIKATKNKKYYTTLTNKEVSLPIPVYFPEKGLSTDNAIMIALAAYHHAVKKEFADANDLRANGRLSLG